MSVCVSVCLSVCNFDGEKSSTGESLIIYVSGLSNVTNPHFFCSSFFHGWVTKPNLDTYCVHRSFNSPLFPSPSPSM